MNHLRPILIIILCCSLKGIAQKYFIPKDFFKDSVQFKTFIPKLAKQIVDKASEAKTDKELDDKFRIQLAAGQYQEAINTLNAIRKKEINPETAKAIGLQYESYALLKLKPTQDSATYVKILKELFSKINLEASLIVSDYFQNDTNDIKIKLNRLFNDFKNKDSLSTEQATLLCRTYNSYKTYSSILPFGKPFVTNFNDQLFIIEDSVILKTRDGAEISYWLVRNKKNKGKQPCVLMFNIYSGIHNLETAKIAAANGYVGMVANTRGKNLSKQAIEPFEHDADDAYDIIEWINKQTWSNGKVGMYGGSYLGFSQWAATKKLHPALKTIIPQVAVGIGIDYPMHNNTFMSYMLRWIHFVSNSKNTDYDEFENEKKWADLYTTWYRSGKAFNSMDSIEGRPSAIFQRWLQHPSYDSYWKNMVPYQQEFSNINIPVLTTTGYYDDDQRGAMYYFKKHHEFNKNTNHYLVIGPYSHYGAQGEPNYELGNYVIDSAARVSFNDLAFEWFNFTLKNGNKPKLLKDKINYQVMDANTWKHAPSLNKMNNDTLRFYLSNTYSNSFYQMNTSKESKEEYIKQEIDLTDRSDSLERADYTVIRSTINTNDALSFVSKPFTEAVEINGSFLGEINLAINKKDLDLAMTLYELREDGTYFVLSTFIGRASYLKNNEERQLLEPNKKSSIAFINSFFTSKKIAAGSKLVLVLGINKNPEWQLNYGTGKDVSTETINDAKEPMNIKWFNDSYINIPVWKGK